MLLMTVNKQIIGTFFGNGFDETKRNELIEKYIGVINKIFRCACDESCNTIIFGLIGCGCFF